jgi:hypothetical protein
LPAKGADQAAVLLAPPQAPRAERVVAAENARFGEVVVANGAQKGVLRELQRRFQPWGLHLQVAVADKVDNPENRNFNPFSPPQGCH